MAIPALLHCSFNSGFKGQTIYLQCTFSPTMSACEPLETRDTKIPTPCSLPKQAKQNDSHCSNRFSH